MPEAVGKDAGLSTTDRDLSTSIAIVGMAGRFPGAKSVAELWRGLVAGEEALTHFADEELIASGVDPALLEDPAYVKAGMVLDRIDLFDAGLFGYAPREAQLMDPQQRLFLEEAWSGLEDAGCDPTRFPGAIGVFAGSALSTYLMRNLAPGEADESEDLVQVLLGNDKDSLATRVAYDLDLRGPCYSVQSYCSTSLVAVSAAATSLLSGECDVALAGGVAITVPQHAGYLYQEGGLLSPDARCRAFDASAQGTPIASGVGVVVLKRAEDAVADRDHIYAVIRGWAVNNDGSIKVGFTAPGVRGQAAVVAEAVANAAVDPADIGYIEAHGTGTALGDASEVAALRKAFGEHSGPAWCALGSVKTNVGHLDRAAGVTGLIKAALAVRHGLIPPSLNYVRPNPEADLEGSPFFVNAELRSWRAGSGKRRVAGVCAFGMGGTNAHVVVEEAPAALPVQGGGREPHLVVLSARSRAAADEAMERLGTHLMDSDDELADVAWSLQVGRREFDHRRAVVAGSRDEAIDALRGKSGGALSSEVVVSERPVGFLLAGVGEHYAGMGGSLYSDERAFREAFDECAGLLPGRLASELTEAVFADGQRRDGGGGGDELARMLGRLPGGEAALGPLARTAVAQPAMFAIEYALARLLASWGIVPSAMLGYSVGEYVAACLSGALELPEALGLVTERARLIDELPEGAMLAVSLGAEELDELLLDELDVTATNGPSLAVVGGPLGAVAEFEAELSGKQIASQRLATTHAFHSRMLEPIGPELTAWVREHVQPRPPRIPYISNLTGTWITEADLQDPAYWARHACGAVRFADGLATLLADQDLALVELGPGRSLGAMARAQPACRRERWPAIVGALPGQHETNDSRGAVVDAVARLWLAGAKIDWHGYGAHHQRRRVPLPTYPFQRQRYWIDGGGSDHLTSDHRGDNAAAVVAAMAPEGVEDWLYMRGWRQVPLPVRAARLAADWIVLTASKQSDQLADALAARGATLIRVRPGARFARIDEDTFELRPRDVADWRALTTTLIDEGRTPSRGLHLWTLGDPIGDEIDLGFHGVASLGRALSEAADGPWTLEVVASGLECVLGDEPVVPARSTVVGPCRVLPAEDADARCRVIDTATDSHHDWTASVLSELDTALTETLVALRNGRRWVPSFQRASAPSSDKARSPFRQRGVYLITGGLGGVGLGLAEEMAKDVQARLVLIGRSGLPPRTQWAELLANDQLDDDVRRRIESVGRIEAAGGEAMIIRADVASEDKLAEAIASARSRFGHIDGVLHAAGVPGIGLLQLKKPAAMDKVLAPKVAGTLALARCLADDPPELLVLFSSVAGLTGGGPGQSDYCSGNAFLDAWARAADGATRTVSIDWGEWRWNAWDEALEAYPPEAQQFFRDNRTRLGIDFERGYRALGSAIALELPQVVISTTDFQTMVGLSDAFTAQTILGATQAGVARHPRPELMTSYVPPRTEEEEKLADIWATALGLEQVGVEDDFFDLGGNSLVGAGLIARIRRELRTPGIPTHALYETPTIAALARFIGDHPGGQRSVDDLRLHAESRRQRLARVERI